MVKPFFFSASWTISKVLKWITLKYSLTALDWIVSLSFIWLFLLATHELQYSVVWQASFSGQSWIIWTINSHTVNGFISQRSWTLPLNADFFFYNVLDNLPVKLYCFWPRQRSKKDECFHLYFTSNIYRLSFNVRRLLEVVNDLLETRSTCSLISWRNFSSAENLSVAGSKFP